MDDVAMLLDTEQLSELLKVFPRKVFSMEVDGEMPRAIRLGRGDRWGGTGRRSRSGLSRAVLQGSHDAGLNAPGLYEATPRAHRLIRTIAPAYRSTTIFFLSQRVIE